MEQIFTRFFPNTTSGQTLTFSVLGRPNKGTGSFTTAIPTLTVVYSTYNDGVPFTQVVDALVEYAMENGFGQLTSPRAGQSPEGALRELLNTIALGTTSTGVTVRIYLDGPEDVYMG